MKKAVVVGAGFSGMMAAYYLLEAGYEVEIFEKENHLGGLIKTVHTQWGHCELAANGLLNSVQFESLCKKIRLKIVASGKESKNRYIFRGEPKRWPLNLLESVLFLFRLLFLKFRPPKKMESVSDWGHRTLGHSATGYLLEPVLQGIYAGAIKELSATLILSRVFKKFKKKKPNLRGLVAPENGMSELFEKLQIYLQSQGVKIHLAREFNFEKRENGIIYILATSATACGALLKTFSKNMSEKLDKIQMISLVRSTQFYSHEMTNKLKGFGVLFPQDQGFRSLGVLFNDFIFLKSQEYKSESYILGGAPYPKVIDDDDAAIQKGIESDRESLFGKSETPKGFLLKRWPKALPHYNLHLEKTLEEIAEDRVELERQGIYLIGNYLGGIGLSKILEEASVLPQRIERNGK